jgi:hypothetical protein
MSTSPNQEPFGVPELLQKLVSRLLGTAVAILRDEEELAPIAFVVSTSTSAVEAVLLNQSGEKDKQESLAGIRQHCLRPEVDGVLVFTEGWGLSSDMGAHVEEIRQRFGSIADSPYRVDTFLAILETPDQRWMALSELQPHPSAAGRVFKEALVFVYQGQPGQLDFGMFSDFFLYRRTH